MKTHNYEVHHMHNVYYPFADREEWKLAKFLSDNLNQGQITQFLKLLWKCRNHWHIQSAQQMFTFMDALPKGPKWRCMTIHTEALEVMQHIFGNSIFANNVEFDPYEIKVNREREYSEWMSCSRAHKIQDQLPPGATIVPIVLASEKTPITHQSGALEMHPMFLTTANIRSDIRIKATMHAWSCIAYMPIPQFVCHPDFCSLLQARVWHWCVDIMCENLKIAAATGTSMVDLSSHLRYAFTPLVAYTANLPKQQMIACLCQCVDPWKVQQFQEEAKALYLSGWCKEVLGADELDSRFRRQHKSIGTRHFAQGVSHVQQMTGREHRNIQRTIVATIAGVADPGFTQAICALINFIYQAQSPTFTPSSITAMTSSLAEFHHLKGAIINAEACRGTTGPIEHFDIPKLELLSSFARVIPNIGAPIQFTTKTSERMLITHCKSPFVCTSHQRASFTQQIVRFLDREDTARQFDLYALLHSKTLSLNNLIDNEFEEVVDIDPAFSWIARVTPEDITRFHGPHPIRNYFLKGLLSEDSTVAFHVTVSSDLADKSPNLLAQLYQLPSFPDQLRSFIEHVNGPGPHFQTCLLKVWNKFCLQLHSDLRPCLVMPSQQVQAYPPSQAYPLGNCDVVLLRTQNDDQVVVGQVQMVFGLSTRGSTLPPELAEPLLYIQLFEVISRPQDDPVVMMYRVRRRFKTRPDGTQARLGIIVPLVDVTHAIELIPEYGERVNCDVTSATSLELYDTFYLNSFSDKEWYHSLHTDFW
ncbi:uncharacterized protein EDB93DRAFT_1239317 [Suillus bovinus]|uniref:uncharacterized protein n=1 Tax=Suillus bovinus TaxID=48563 RepID=UPI001B86C842|nr:uncharacterized protein EDB93DRAFT_1239317 [Suillus bovinus]KAG2155027.1 hypothetical protein EDB93DRAFT_1239317 [Suillus bovinus]